MEDALDFPIRLTSTVAGLALLATGCASTMQGGGERTTSRDKTTTGAAIGAAGGAIAGAVLGEGELDEVLAGAAIGAGIGAGVGAYMDAQEEKLARIPGTTVERVGDNLLLVRFESDVLFAVDSAVLSPASRSSLDSAARVFVDYPKTAIIAQGHTDSSGTEEHNQALSERRAAAVVSYLVGRGIDASRITALGYGEGSPIESNDSSAGRQANRRVDLLLKAKAR
jgi:outer membrane protein OmpA-like peptidoglycan-associated protein